MILCAASNGNGLFVFTDSTFSTNGTTGGVVYLNGTSVKTGNPDIVEAFTLAYIGQDYSGVNLTGNIGEIIIYNNVLAGFQREIVNSYLGLKWGIVTT